MKIRARAGVIASVLLGSAALALGAAFPARLRIPPKDPAARRTVPPAAFSHRSHQAFGCFACHPTPFPQALVGFTHGDMRDGRFCGRCHDGRTAFAVDGTACGRCHAPSE